MNMEPATATPQKSIWGIIGDVFFSPIEAFEAFKQKPTIWVPLILVVVMAAAAGFFTVEQATMDQLEMMKTSTLPAPIIEQMRQDAQNPNPVTAAIVPAIMVPIFGMLSALLAWFIGGFLLGGKAKFMEIWGVGLLASSRTHSDGRWSDPHTDGDCQRNRASFDRPGGFDAGHRLRLDPGILFLLRGRICHLVAGGA